jgi:hypothetical protein
MYMISELLAGKYIGLLFVPAFSPAGEAGKRVGRPF